MKWLLIEAYFMLGWARYRKRLSFSKISPSLGAYMEETSSEHNASNKEIAQNISSALYLMSRFTFWESECLVKAMAAMKMLERRQIESTLYLGTAKDETGLIAHAWLRTGTYYVSGRDGMERFTVVSTFAKYLENVTNKGECHEHNSQY